jgi:hypothetical protein
MWCSVSANTKDGIGYHRFQYSGKTALLGMQASQVWNDDLGGIKDEMWRLTPEDIEGGKYASLFVVTLNPGDVVYIPMGTLFIEMVAPSGSMCLKMPSKFYVSQLLGDWYWLSQKTSPSHFKLAMITVLRDELAILDNVELKADDDAGSGLENGEGEVTPSAGAVLKLSGCGESCFQTIEST